MRRGVVRSRLTRTFVFFLLHGSYAIAALYIGCTDTCDNDGHDIVMSVQSYLIVGGIIKILGVLCMTANWNFDPTEMTAKQAAAHCCAAVWDTCWTLIGSVLFIQLSYECEHSNIGLMLFAWISINYVYVGC